MQKLKPAQIVGHLQQLADMAGRLSDKIGIGQTRKPELDRQLRVQWVAMDQRYFRPTKHRDLLGRLSEDSEDDDIAIHYRITLQTLQKHLTIPRIRKLVIAEIIEVRPNLSFFEAGQLADKCFHERYGHLIEFARLHDSQKKAIPWKITYKNFAPSRAVQQGMPQSCKTCSSSRMPAMKKSNRNCPDASRTI